jgi:hypothetical protein
MILEKKAIQTLLSKRPNIDIRENENIYSYVLVHLLRMNIIKYIYG